MRRLEQRVALVSGAASGIGAAVVTALRAEGAIVVGGDIQEAEGCRSLDVTDPESVTAVVAHCVATHGKLDIVVNVAGIGVSRLIEDVPLEEWKRILDVNLTGTFLLSQAAVGEIRKTKGTIINMASVAGVRATPYNAAYCASKGGVIMLTKSMAIELASAGVRVNAICPASVDTPFLRNFEIPDGADMSLFDRARSPMGKLVDPAEVGATVVFLASDDAATINGTALVIDGAATA